MSAGRRLDPDYAEPLLTAADLQGAIQRALEHTQPQVVYQQNGWKVAATILGALASILLAIGAWGLNTLLAVQKQVDAMQADMLVVKCQLSDACKHPILERGG